MFINKQWIISSPYLVYGVTTLPSVIRMHIETKMRYHRYLLVPGSQEGDNESMIRKKLQVMLYVEQSSLLSDFAEKSIHSNQFNNDACQISPFA